MEFTQYREILDSLPNAIVYCDLDHVIRYMNPAAEHYYYELLDYENLLNKSLMDCHPPQAQTGILRLVEAMRQGAAETPLGTTSVNNYRIYVVPVRDKSGELIGYLEQFEHA